MTRLINSKKITLCGVIAKARACSNSHKLQHPVVATCNRKDDSMQGEQAYETGARAGGGKRSEIGGPSREKTVSYKAATA